MVLPSFSSNFYNVEDDLIFIINNNLEIIIKCI